MLHERLREVTEVYVGSHGAFTADPYWGQIFYIRLTKFEKITPSIFTKLRLQYLVCHFTFGGKKKLTAEHSKLNQINLITTWKAENGALPS